MSMAVQLRMDFSKLEEIEHQNSEPKSRLQTSMHAWLETDSEASWKRVVGALGAIKKNELALELEKKYCNPAACSADTSEYILYTCGSRILWPQYSSCGKGSM